MNMNISRNLPAIGEPMAAAKPWNKSKNPNAFVNFSSPINSTAMMERNEAQKAKHK